MPVKLSTMSKVLKKAETKGVQAEMSPIPPPTKLVTVGHVNLSVYVKMHPHAAKMRKTKRFLRAIKPSHKTELWYKAQLLQIVKVLKASTKDILLPKLKNDYRDLDYVHDAAPKMRASKVVPVRTEPLFDLDETMRDMRKKVVNLEGVAKKLTSKFVAMNLGDVDTRLGKSINASLGVNVTPFFTLDGPIRDKITAATETNVALIQSIGSQYYDRIEQAVKENYLAGRRFESLEDTIKDIGDVTDSRAKLIARDQTAKLNSSFNMARQTSLGIEKYQWQTSGDERVRESHADNEGQIFSWDDPPEETGNPGDDVNCRCVALPYFDLDQMEEDAED